MRYKIPFNKPFLTGNELNYMTDAVNSGHISGNGKYTKLCQVLLNDKYGFKKSLLTTSCTDALEMSALLINIKKGDEVIVPTYTFVTSALAFVREGATIVFADSRKDHPSIDETKIEELISPKTKAIVVVHYAGIACDMETIMTIAEKHNLFVIEDAAQGIDSFYKGKPLGSIGHFGTFSFHETKNVNCGEGGLLAINDIDFINRAEILWEKGTNRTSFFRGEVDKYGWVDTGSSFLPSELSASFLYAQLENLKNIQSKRKKIWIKYYKGLKKLERLGKLKLPLIPDYATNNAHMFYIITNNHDDRTNLIQFLKSKGILAVFHYPTLHTSKFFVENLRGETTQSMINAIRYSECLLRLPLYYELSDTEIDEIIETINMYFQ